MAKDGYTRKQISFNENCPHQRELLDYCVGASSNFSGFVKDVLLLYKETKIKPASNNGESRVTPIQNTNDNASFIADIL